MVTNEPDPAAEALHLQLAGYEGPLDLLLDLARRQRVDLAAISVLTLADQYIDAIAARGRVNFRQAADWLVMAAWLTWLKSRLLVPKGMDADGEAEQAARVLTGRLAELQQIRVVTAWLEARPQLGRDMFEPSRAEAAAGQSVAADFQSLFEATLDVLEGRDARPTLTYRPPTRDLWSVADALARTRAMIAARPDGGDVMDFVPNIPANGPGRELWRKAATASTVVAVLEMAKDGHVDLRQDEPFGRILVRAK